MISLFVIVIPYKDGVATSPADPMHPSLCQLHLA